MSIHRNVYLTLVRKGDREGAVTVGGRLFVIDNGGIVVAALHNEILDQSVDASILVQRLDVAVDGCAHGCRLQKRRSVSFSV